MRCPWCLGEKIYIEYHDNEWGVPVRDDNKIFEFIVLESAQAGLSWLTILKKREEYRRCFFEFNIQKVAAISDEDIYNIMTGNWRIIKNLSKIKAAVQNARGAIKIIEEFGSLYNYFWSFTDGKPVINHWKRLEQLPAQSALSERIFRDLKRNYHFSFFGPKIVYAHLQATGVINDHLENCFCYQRINNRFWRI